eukprot:1689011-Rhodomonas_salina.4
MCGTGTADAIGSTDMTHACACALQCAVPALRMRVLFYVMCSTDPAYARAMLCDVRYLPTMGGTDRAYVFALPCAVLTRRMVR